ncbi:MarR family transcriptional regulator [Streptomyces sp. NPDC001185]|uniref:MarR family winged helix-turn-helix transcriptional regulator n=1 Tax=unclassified Streptomyces TaxID=2593676 RepID=UPI00332DD40F
MSDSDRADLGALFAWVTDRLVDAEAPLLAASGLTMWEYIVLDRLSRRPAPNQLTLAREIKHDKTRLIKLLDRLQQRALIDRQRDASDRRSQTVSITSEGRALHATARAAIREMEDEFLAVLEPDERRSLLAILPRLAPQNHHSSS